MRPKKKERPLSMRLPEADVAIIDRAAALQAAEEVLMETAFVRSHDARRLQRFHESTLKACDAGPEIGAGPSAPSTLGEGEKVTEPALGSCLLPSPWSPRTMFPGSPAASRPWTAG
jgi:hypothetical protein